MMTKEEAERLRVGMRLAEIREAKGLTQQQVADDAGLIQSNLARIETGRYSSTLDTLAKVAEALGCKLDITEK